MRNSLVFACVVYFAVLASGEDVFEAIDDTYKPDWESLDARPLPEWYDKAKFGIFIHWGVFSVPAFGSEWFWSNWKISNKSEYVEFMNRNYRPNFTYQEFAKDFTAEFFDPEKWAELFVSSGARYVVLTSKHHEGYTLWPSRNSFGWNARDVGPGRDLVGELAAAVKARNLKFGVYHSLYEWFNPLYLHDKGNDFATGEFVRAKTMPELRDLVTAYAPEIIWSDGEWEAPDSYWNSKQFLAWLYNDSPVKDTVVTNDRWGRGTLCKHGGFFTCSDRFSPDELQPFKFENCLTIDRRSWGFRRNADLSQYMTVEELIRELVKTVSCGGNILINVGPTKEGVIAPIYEERLLQIGSWLSVNGEAIYDAKPWTFQKDALAEEVWYTKQGNHVYCCFLSWPRSDSLVLGSPRLQHRSLITLLGHDGENLPWQQENARLRVSLPRMNDVRSKWAFVLKISDVSN